MGSEMCIRDRLSTVMVPTCGSDGARQSRVQQPQQLGAPTVDATECGCSGRLSRSIRTDDPPFCLDRDIATGAGYVPATSEVVVVSADRAAATPCTRPGRALRNNVLKMLHLRRFCPTLACNIPSAACHRQCIQVAMLFAGCDGGQHTVDQHTAATLPPDVVLVACHALQMPAAAVA